MSVADYSSSRRFHGLTSCRRPSERTRTAVLVAAYTALFFPTLCPATDETLMMCPVDGRLKPLGASRSKHHSCAALGEIPRRRFAQPAAGAGNHDDLAGDVRIGRAHFAGALMS